MKNLISFQDKIFNLTKFHYKNSLNYKNIINNLNQKDFKKEISLIPFLPAKLFKVLTLRSIPETKIFKILKSSGTSGGSPSIIYLDKENAQKQTIALSKIMQPVLGKYRIPMLIVDSKPEKINQRSFDAKRAAVIGFSTFGKNYTYLLNSKKEIDYKVLNNFLKDNQSQDFLIFGFTSAIYSCFYNNINFKNVIGNFKNGIVLHGGGWKKMNQIKVSNQLFKKNLFLKNKFKKIINYYGLIEQTGSIFIECQKCLCFNTNEFSEILIRDKNFNIIKNGQKGYIQLLSLLPKSYPGHSILTEDVGEIVKNKRCSCQSLGKQFLVHGRVENSEIRGCSDV
tara:strand:+ start:2228 stop:3241 length:1014 start_codon:yes stop_codon:yes gene_type:complete